MIFCDDGLMITFWIFLFLHYTINWCQYLLPVSPLSPSPRFFFSSFMHFMKRKIHALSFILLFWLYRIGIESCIVNLQIVRWLEVGANIFFPPSKMELKGFLDNGMLCGSQLRTNNIGSNLKNPLQRRAHVQKTRSVTKRERDEERKIFEGER